MKSESSVQKSGWIVWWINTILYVLAAVAFIVLFYVVDILSFAQASNADKAFAFIIWMLLVFLCRTDASISLLYDKVHSSR